MRDIGADAGPTSVGEYAAILRRRWLVLAAAIVGVPVVAVALSSLVTPEYRASAEVLIRTENLAAALSGVADTTGGGDPTRLLDTQSKLARTPAVAAAVVKRVGGGLSPTVFLRTSSVSADPNADILTFSAVATTPESAVRLANAYAFAYTRYRTSLDVSPVAEALGIVNRRLRTLREANEVDLPVYASLLSRQQDLESIRALRSQSAVVVNPASSAVKTQPRLVYAGLVGLVAGLLLGVALALVWEAVEKRPRSDEELQEQLGIRLLGRIPSKSESGDGIITLLQPAGLDQEPYRMLRMNFEHVASEAGAHIVAVTSAIEGEGKSTVASNLAVALASVGHDVILVDCDTLRPVLRERFRILHPSAGVFEAATGRTSLERALSEVSLPSMALPSMEVAPKQVRGRASEFAVLESTADYPGVAPDRMRSALRPPTIVNDGSLQVLPSNQTSAELSDYLVATRLEGLFEQLRDAAEFVIVDTAPLTTSVGMGVAHLVDAVVVVTNVAVIRRPMVKHLKRMLDELNPAKLGLVLTGVERDITGMYGYNDYPAIKPTKPEPPESSVPPVKRQGKSRAKAS